MVGALAAVDPVRAPEVDVNPLCPDTVLRCADIYARKHVPARLRHWRDDIAADAALHVVELAERGIPASSESWRWAIIDAVPRHGSKRTQHSRTQASARHSHSAVDALESSSTHDEMAWALSRLRAVWPTLTTRQQSSVMHWLAGEVTPGMHRTRACRARAVALERMRLGIDTRANADYRCTP